MYFDTVIKDGTIVDGTRAPRFRADIGIKDGRIEKIGRIGAESTAGAKVIDAEGYIVAPGFVDMHTHYDAQLFWDPYCTISGWHGVTTVVIGNCGFGFAPVKANETDRERAMRMLERVEQIPYQAMKEAIDWSWESYPEWLDALERTPKGINILSFCPVSPLMIYVMGLEAAKSRPATPAEQAEMKRLLHEAMDAGAAGFSVQRLGKHSAQADTDGTPMPTDMMANEDLFALAEVLRERGEGFIQTTQAFAGDPVRWTDEVRQKDWDFLEKLAEISQRPILHNVVAVFNAVPDFHKKELAWLHRCAEKGLTIYGQGANLRTFLDIDLRNWNLYDACPAWNRATQGTIEERVEKMSDPAVRKEMRDQYEMILPVGEEAMPHSLIVHSVPENSGLERYVGRRVGEIAEEEGKHPNDAMLDIALAGGLAVGFRTTNVTSLDEDLVAPLQQDPFILPGTSDDGAHTKIFTGGSFTTDFLVWLVRDTGYITLEDAHHHLSYLPCRVAGIPNRGLIAEGMQADMVIYKLDELARIPQDNVEIVHDLPGGEWRVVQRAKGYHYILVNGVVTFEDDVCTGAVPGQLIRQGRELTASQRRLEKNAA